MDEFLCSLCGGWDDDLQNGICEFCTSDGKDDRMSEHECHAIKCDKPAQYYAFQLWQDDVSGYFCYWHLPERWVTEPLVGDA